VKLQGRFAPLRFKQADNPVVEGSRAPGTNGISCQCDGGGTTECVAVQDSYAKSSPHVPNFRP